MTAPSGRLPLVDALKAVASQLIVLHHLAFYGPMSDATALLAPDAVHWFSNDARMAVQVFLVLGGFLAVRSLAPDGVWRGGGWGLVVWRRYVAVALPLVVAVGITVACNEWARLGMTHSSLSDPPQWAQWWAHVALLQGVLGYESLSAGVWYVAIDFQLFALLSLWLWLALPGAPAPAPGRWPPARVVAGVALAVVASAVVFNRDPDGDNWAPYFMAAYGLGALAHWAGRVPLASWRSLWFVVAALGVALGLAVDFRERLALAAWVALALAVAARTGGLQRWGDHPVLNYLGRVSYGVFLMNFAVGLLVNAAFTRWASADPWVQTAGVAVAWLATLLAGAAFHHGVEEPLRRWSRGSGAALRLATSGGR